MKVALAAVIGLSLVGVVAAPVSVQASEAQAYRHHKAKNHYRHALPRYRDRVGRSDYYEHLADKLPVGSSRWFEQMEREGRFGRRQD